MITRRLSPNGPINVDVALRMLAAHAIPGVEAVDLPQRTCTRPLNREGRPTPVRLTFSLEEITLEAAVQPSPGHEIAAEIRRWLDLDPDIDEMTTRSPG